MIPILFLHLIPANSLPHLKENRYIQGRIPVTADMAIRLGKTLGNGPQLWLNLQYKVDIWDIMQEKASDYNKVCSVN